MSYSAQESKSFMEVIREDITGTVYFRVIFYTSILALFVYQFIHSYLNNRKHRQIQKIKERARKQQYLRIRQKSIQEQKIKRLQKEAQRLMIDDEDLSYHIQDTKRISQNSKLNGKSKLKDYKRMAKQSSITIEDLKEKYKLQTRQELIRNMNKTKQQEELRQRIDKQDKIREQKYKQAKLHEQKSLKNKELEKQINDNVKVKNGTRTLQKKSTIQVILEQPDQQSQTNLSKQNSNNFLSGNKLQQIFFDTKTDKILEHNISKNLKGTLSQDNSKSIKLLQPSSLFEKQDQGSFKKINSTMNQNKQSDLFKIPNLPPIISKPNTQKQVKQQTLNSSENNKSLFFNPPSFSISQLVPPSLFIDKVEPLNKKQVITQKKPQMINSINSEPKRQENNQNKQNYIPKKDDKISLKPNKLNLTSLQYFEILINYASKQTVSAKIPTVFSNLGGPKSSLNDVLTFATSFISSLKKDDDKHLTSFALQTYDSIIYLIKVANQRDGIYRLPPKQKSGQVQKNSINNYVLMINIYRLMGYEKIWLLFFGKLLKELQFIFKRQEQLKSFKDFQLIKNNHMQMSGQLQGRILSRMDNLIYALLALTAFDPILIFKYIETKDPQIRKSRQQIESWGRQWSYKQFWMLMDVILKKKNHYYFKPIIYINLLYVLYPKIYENKLNKTKFIPEANLYLTIIDQSKQFFSKISTNAEMQQLKKDAPEDGNSNFTYDGGTFYDGIKTLEARICVEKFKQYKNYTLDEFQKKCNTLYYFCKEK